MIKDARRLRPASFLAAFAACAAFAAGGAADAKVTHRYTVKVSPGLDRLAVEARFDGRVDSVAARSRRAGRYLLDFRNCGADPQIRLRNDRLIVPPDGIRCMAYTVDLEAAADAERENRALAAHNRIASSSLWLWRPEITDTTGVEIRFELPDGVAVAVPWAPLDASGTRFAIPRSPESAHAPVVFGRFDAREIHVPGATLRLALLDGTTPMDADELAAWVEAAATDVTLAYGTFPNPSPQVLVIPVAEDGRRPGSAVPFGRVVRDGGESIELYVNQRRPLEAFLEDWTATHEFSHLMLPYVERRHRWISEGFAQYYQNVLLARSGAYDDLRAWQKLYEGFERGRVSRPELSPNAAAAAGTRAGRMKVYWSGAAIALMADVALRERSGGTQTLDDVLRELMNCCLPSDRTWSGPELFATLDVLAGEDVFMPLYRRYADTIGFPDPMPVFERLGLRIDHGRVRLLRNASLIHIRNDITAVDHKTAAWREHLAMGR